MLVHSEKLVLCESELVVLPGTFNRHESFCNLLFKKFGGYPVEHSENIQGHLSKGLGIGNREQKGLLSSSPLKSQIPKHSESSSEEFLPKPYNRHQHRTKIGFGIIVLTCLFP
jgi:hypothetical protein